MAATISVTEYSVFVALRAWIQYVIGTNVEVVQELDNRVPTPVGGFILMNCLNRSNLSWPVISFTDDDAIGTAPAVTLQTNTLPIDYAVQVDCYGPLAGDWATMLDATWHSMTTTGFLEIYPIYPLYSEGPKQVPFIDGESQYQHRWVVVLHLQYNPAVSFSQQFADIATISLINVDAVYPAI